MGINELVLHRLRDFDSVFRSKNKFRLLVYILLRQFVKLLRIDEKKISGIIKDGESKILSYKFYTRKKTLDFLFLSKYYEPETTKFIIKNKGEIFIDIGSHIGRFAVLASDRYKKVYAVEPHPSNFNSLNKNIQINRSGNIDSINCAISNSDVTLFLDDLEINTGASKLKKTGKNKIKIEKLDNLITKMNIPLSKINLVLIDVEGHEIEVLKSGKKLLKYGNTKLIIESFDINVLENFLKEFGYTKKKTMDDYNHLFTKD